MMEGYRHVTPIAVRFRDLDAMGHVNNAVFFTYLESARVEYIRRGILGEDRVRNFTDRVGLILAKISCEFKTPIYYGQQVEVGTRVVEMRNSSFVVEQRIEADGRLATLAEAIVVHYDYQSGQSVRIPDDVRARVEMFEGEGQTA
jgi:acyl-CoA thioester hydrolase